MENSYTKDTATGLPTTESDSIPTEDQTNDETDAVAMVEPETPETGSISPNDPSLDESPSTASGDTPGDVKTNSFADDTEMNSVQNAQVVSPSVGSNLTSDTRSPQKDDDMKCLYHIKWIEWGEDRTPIVTQNVNGPCPLIAVFNVLLLSKKVLLDSAAEIISTSQIMAHVADVIWNNMPKELPEHERLNYEQNVADAMSVFPNLQTGLDVNVKFSTVSSFEYTPELTVFDLLRIPLYHGWLIDPQDAQVQNVIGNLSYNQIVEKIITCKSSEDDAVVQEGLVAEQFLESTASQITCHGIVCLCEQLNPGSLAVLFRNNHFSTIFRHNDELFTLVTDLGFLRESTVVWETLSSIQGDSHFVDGRFLNSPPKRESATQDLPPSNTDYDYQIALSLREGQDQVPGPSVGYQKVEATSDYELAMQLQREEEMEAQKRQQHARRQESADVRKSRPHVAAPHHHGTAHERESRPESAPQHRRSSQDGSMSKCAIL